MNASPAFKEVFPEPAYVDARVEMGPAEEFARRSHRFRNRFQLVIRASNQRTEEGLRLFNLHPRSSRQSPLNSLIVPARRSRLIWAVMRCPASST